MLSRRTGCGRGAPHSRRAPRLPTAVWHPPTAAQYIVHIGPAQYSTQAQSITPREQALAKLDESATTICDSPFDSAATALQSESQTKRVLLSGTMVTCRDPSTQSSVTAHRGLRGTSNSTHWIVQPVTCHPPNFKRELDQCATMVDSVITCLRLVRFIGATIGRAMGRTAGGMGGSATFSSVPKASTDRHTSAASAMQLRFTSAEHRWEKGKRES